MEHTPLDILLSLSLSLYIYICLSISETSEPLSTIVFLFLESWDLSMSIFEGSCTASSLESSSSSNTSTASPSIQMVSKSVSERLLGKFFDASQYDFDYEQSGLWSPPIQRRAFLDSPGKICSQDVIFSKLKRANKAWNWRRIFCFNIVSAFLHYRSSFLSFILG